MAFKVLLDCRFWGPSHTGLGRYTQELVMAMRGLKPKIKLEFLTPKLSKIKPYSWAEQRQLTKEIKSHQPDLTHFLHFNVPLNFSGPFVVTIHDLIKHHSRGLTTTTHWAGTYWLKRLGYYLVVKKAILESKAILVPSQWVKTDILAHYPVKPEKIVVTPEAAGTDYFKPTTGKTLPYPYFIYVGNAYPHKNVAGLIKAVQRVKKIEPKIKLLIVTGRDFFYRQLRQQITVLKAQNCVKLTEFTSDQDLRRLYFNSVAFVTASYFEGFGLPGLEALAAKTLVIASRRAALPEVYGRAATYFNPDDLDDMNNKLIDAYRLTSKQRQARIKIGINHARQFSWQKTAQQTLKVYERCFGV